MSSLTRSHAMTADTSGTLIAWISQERSPQPQPKKKGEYDFNPDMKDRLLGDAHHQRHPTELCIPALLPGWLDGPASEPSNCGTRTRSFLLCSPTYPRKLTMA